MLFQVYLKKYCSLLYFKQFSLRKYEAVSVRRFSIKLANLLQARAKKLFFTVEQVSKIHIMSPDISKYLQMKRQEKAK